MRLLVTLCCLEEVLDHLSQSLDVRVDHLHGGVGEHGGSLLRLCGGEGVRGVMNIIIQNTCKMLKKLQK